MCGYRAGPARLTQQYYIIYFILYTRTCWPSHLSRFTRDCLPAASPRLLWDSLKAWSKVNPKTPICAKIFTHFSQIFLGPYPATSSALHWGKLKSRQGWEKNQGLTFVCVEGWTIMTIEDEPWYSTPSYTKCNCSQGSNLCRPCAPNWFLLVSSS